RTASTSTATATRQEPSRASRRSSPGCSGGGRRHRLRSSASPAKRIWTPAGSSAPPSRPDSRWSDWYLRLPVGGAEIAYRERGGQHDVVRAAAYLVAVEGGVDGDNFETTDPRAVEAVPDLHRRACDEGGVSHRPQLAPERRRRGRPPR